MTLSALRHKNILLYIINHTYINEVQTITQIFFPNAKFNIQCLSEQEYLLSRLSSSQPLLYPIPLRTEYFIVSRLTETDCMNEVYRFGGSLIDCDIIGSNTVNLAANGMPVRRLLMLALYHALQQVFNRQVPWGALTGIRPSKLVRQWMSEGQSDGAIGDTLTNTMKCRADKAALALTVARAENRIEEKYRLNSPNTAALYINIPYCPSRCLYCSFTTSAARHVKDDIAAYLQALAKEMESSAQYINGNSIELTSIYIGGGTPTVLDVYQLESLLSLINRLFNPSVEFTVEAGRPDTITQEKLRLLCDFGVTRISISPQSANDETLRRIGRNHTSADFVRAFDMARGHGFININTDIIAGLPGERINDVQNTIHTVTSLQPESITVHTLAIKRSSRLNEHLRDKDSINQPVMAGSDEIDGMLTIAYEGCEQAGMSPYYLYRQKNMIGNFENVGYCQPGFECIYNVGMMADMQTVIGVGAGAVSKWVAGDRIERTFNVKNPDLYIKGQK